MPTGPQGQKRPADLVACAVHVCRISTGEIEESPPIPPETAAKAAAGRQGGKARAEKLTAAQRREIARKGAEARWGQ